MASGVMIMILSEALKEEKWTIESPRAELVKESASYLLSKAAEPAFDTFSADMQQLLEKIVSKLSKYKPTSKSFKNRLWASYHSIRRNDLSSIWEKMWDSLNAPEKFKVDPLLMQHCSTKLFEITVKQNIQLVLPVVMYQP